MSRDKPKPMEVEIEKDIEEDDKVPLVLKTEVERAIKDLKNRKSAGIDEQERAFSVSE